jgi:hypothetical protein
MCVFLPAKGRSRRLNLSQSLRISGVRMSDEKVAIRKRAK